MIKQIRTGSGNHNSLHRTLRTTSFLLHFCRKLDVARMQAGKMRISLKLFQRRPGRGFQFYKPKDSHRRKDFQSDIAMHKYVLRFRDRKGEGTGGWLFETSQLNDKWPEKWRHYARTQHSVNHFLGSVQQHQRPVAFRHLRTMTTYTHKTENKL